MKFINGITNLKNTYSKPLNIFILILKSSIKNIFYTNLIH